MVKALGIIYLALVFAVTASALYLWRLRCEGFGCIGIGIAWFGWVVALYLPVGVAGLFACGAALGPGLRKAVHIALWAQVMLEVGLLGYYMVWRQAQ